MNGYDAFLQAAQAQAPTGFAAYAWRIRETEAQRFEHFEIVLVPQKNPKTGKISVRLAQNNEILKKDTIPHILRSFKEWRIFALPGVAQS